MQILAIISRKGGVGKSTLAAHLAVEAERQQAGPVVLIDADPQRSLGDWWDARNSQTPVLANTSAATLERDLEVLAGEFKLAIIDTPPALSREISSVVRLADLVLIPSRPSPNDLRAIGGSIELAEAAKKRMVFVVNQAVSRTRIAAEAAIELSQHGTVSPVAIGARTDFATSMIDGRTVMELAPDGKSALEIADLCKYVLKQIRKVKDVKTSEPIGQQPDRQKTG